MKTDSTKNTARRQESPIASFARLVVAPTAYAEMLTPAGTAYAHILASIPPRTKPAHLVETKPPAHAPQLVPVHEFAGAFQAPDWLIKRVAQRGFFYTLTAPTNHGKTALAVLMAICVAAGIPLNGRAVRRGRVIYLAGENPEDVRGRMIATAQMLSVDLASIGPWLDIRPGATELQTAYDQIRAEADAKGETALVIIDTSTAFFSYGDENDNVQALAHAKDARRFTQLRGRPAVLMPSHPTKNATRDQLIPKGGSGLNNEADTNLTLWSDGATVELHHGKIRGPSFDPMKFEFRPIELAGIRDTDGDQVTSVALAPISHLVEQQRLEQRTRDEDQLLVAMKKRPDGSMAEWAKDCGHFDAHGNAEKYRVQRILKRLQASKLAECFRNKYRLTDLGLREATNAQEK